MIEENFINSREKGCERVKNRRCERKTKRSRSGSAW
jgi:hypothetical protein